MDSNNLKSDTTGRLLSASKGGAWKVVAPFLSALLIAGAASSIAPKECHAKESETNSEIVFDSSDINIALPSFEHEFYALKPHKTPEDDQEFPSDNRMPRTVQVLRARNLLAAGHYQEAVVDYTEGLPKWNVPLYFRRGAEHEFALACEKVGKIDDAIKHAKIAHRDELLAKLYLKQGRFVEAKAIADNNVLNNRIFDFDNHNAMDLAPWLQLRAAVECRLHQPENAVRDLKESAQKYYQDDADASNVCMRDANILIKRFKLGAPFTLEEVHQLPSKGKERVIELVKHLSTSANPLNIAELNRITGARIKLPNEAWRDIYQEKKEIPPFYDLEYRSEYKNLSIPHLLMFCISTDECSVSKAEIDSMLVSHGVKIPPISIWDGTDESPYAEAWKLPTGRLFLRFGKGGARVLSYLEFNAPKPDDKVTVTELQSQARGYWQDNEKKIKTLTEAIKLDDHMINLYVDRSHAYCELGRFNEALVDAKRAVALGGRFYLDEQSMVEEKMGNLDDAIKDLKALIGDRTPGPETSSRYTRLAELYVKNKQYREALEGIEKAMIDSKDKSAALFVKAQAEAGLGDLSSARANAKASADDYFSKAEIVLRDRVLDWSKSLPSTQ